jgi:chromosome segregation ATPase
LAALAVKEEAALGRVSAAEASKGVAEIEKEGLQAELSALAKKVKEAEQAVARAISEAVSQKEKLDNKLQNQRQVPPSPPLDPPSPPLDTSIDSWQTRISVGPEVFPLC